MKYDSPSHRFASGKLVHRFLITVAMLSLANSWLVPANAAVGPSTVLITGSSKGHGLAFAHDYAERGWTVIATCRNPSEAESLQALAAKYKSIIVEKLDVTDFDEVDALAEKYRDTPIDVLNLNGAINTFRFGPNKFGDMDYQWFDEIMRVNVIGQLYVAEAFLEHVARSEQKKIAVMSAVGGSIGRVRSSIAPSYRASKAGLNMLMRTYGEAVKPRSVSVLIIAPGTVDTENYLDSEDPETIPPNYQRIIAAGGLAPRSAIGSMIDLIGRLTVDDIGAFHKWDGTVLPW
jgi:NAD(P)-dependent dehydrogenase (short-subunit alcohol dehydrogenase family)